MNPRTPYRDVQRCVLGLVVCAASACLDTGAKSASADLHVAGDTAATLVVRDGWQVSLDQAELAFGPLWLCAGTTAGELCDVSRAEWLDAVVVDALNHDDVPVGELWGSEGDVRSWMYDYGLVSLLTASRPYQMEAAVALGGNSVRLKGCATNETRNVCFSLQLPVAQSTAAEQGVPVVRVGGGRRSLLQFGNVRRVTAVFDARDWIEAVDFSALGAEQTCEGDCGVVEIEADSQAARAVRSALEGTARPELKWKR